MAHEVIPTKPQDVSDSLPVLLPGELAFRAFVTDITTKYRTIAQEKGYKRLGRSSGIDVPSAALTECEQGLARADMLVGLLDLYVRREAQAAVTENLATADTVESFIGENVAFTVAVMDGKKLQEIAPSSASQLAVTARLKRVRQVIARGLFELDTGTAGGWDTPPVPVSLPETPGAELVPLPEPEAKPVETSDEPVADTPAPAEVTQPDEPDEQAAEAAPVAHTPDPPPEVQKAAGRPTAPDRFVWPRRKGTAMQPPDLPSRLPTANVVSEALAAQAATPQGRAELVRSWLDKDSKARERLKLKTAGQQDSFVKPFATEPAALNLAAELRTAAAWGEYTGLQRPFVDEVIRVLTLSGALVNTPPPNRGQGADEFGIEVYSVERAAIILGVLRDFAANPNASNSIVPQT